MKNFGTALSLSAILLLSAFQNSMAARYTPDPISEADSIRYVNMLEEVVLTATRTPHTLKSTPVITRVISAWDIERSGVSTIQEILSNELAGVEFHQAGYGQSISFQGLDARYILFLINGERMAGETYGNVDYSRIPLNNIERIEIVKGASSLMYGSNAMGAVINIITKTADKPVDIQASVKGGTYYQRNRSYVDGIKSNTKLDIPNISADLYAGFNFGKLSSQTTLSYIGSDAYTLRGSREENRHYETATVVDMALVNGRPTPTVSTLTDFTVSAPADTLGLSVSGWKSVNVTQRLDYKANDRWEVYLAGAFYSKSRFDAPESVNTGAATGNYTWETYKAYNLQGGVIYTPDELNTLSITYSGDLYRRNLDSLQYSIPKQRHSFQSPRVLWTTHAGDYNVITSGVEYLREQLNFDLSEYGYNDKRTLNSVAAYIQDEISTNTPLSFVAGVRGDYSNRFGWAVTPKVSAKYSATYCSLRINYSMGYRTPTIKELYINYRIPVTSSYAPEMYIIGNPELKREFNQYVSVAAEYLNEKTRIAVTGFMSFFRDKIDVRGQMGDNGQIMYVYDNIDKSRYLGVEVLARFSPFKRFHVSANYNYIHETEDAPQSSTQYIYVSPHTATLQLWYVFSAAGVEFDVNISGRYIGKKNYSEITSLVSYTDPTLTAMGIPTRIISGTYTATHKAYSLWNVSIGAQISRNLRLMVGVDNVFDYKSPVVNFNSCMAPGINGFAKLVFTFN